MTPSRVLLSSRIVAPLTGGVFVILWLLAEVGRVHIMERGVGYLVIGLVIALAPWLPAVALGGVALVPVLQFVGVLARPESTDWPAGLGLAIALGFVALRDERRWRLSAACAAAIAAVASASVLALPHDRSPFGWIRQDPDFGWASWTSASWSGPQLVIALTVCTLVVLGCGWAAGAAIGYNLAERRTRAVLALAEDDLARSNTERLLSAERERIANDVHDVLAHSLTVVLAQVDGARAGGADDPVLERVSDIARASLIDVRALIERLDGGAQPREPLVSDLPTLISRFTSSGMRVELRESGDRPASAGGLEATVFRIVQECLTNALKHGGRSSTVTVDLDWRGDQLALRVVSRPAPEASDALDAPAGSGLGLASMRERARMTGGWLTAGAEDDAYVVTALLPLRVGLEAVLR